MITRPKVTRKPNGCEGSPVAPPWYRPGLHFTTRASPPWIASSVVRLPSVAQDSLQSAPPNVQGIPLVLVPLPNSAFRSHICTRVFFT
jgi:hypothetical protein